MDQEEENDQKNAAALARKSFSTHLNGVLVEKFDYRFDDKSRSVCLVLGPSDAVQFAATTRKALKFIDENFFTEGWRFEMKSEGNNMTLLAEKGDRITTDLRMRREAILSGTSSAVDDNAVVNEALPAAVQIAANVEDAVEEQPPQQQERSNDDDAEHASDPDFQPRFVTPASRAKSTRKSSQLTSHSILSSTAVSAASSVSMDHEPSPTTAYHQQPSTFASFSSLHSVGTATNNTSGCRRGREAGVLNATSSDSKEVKQYLSKRQERMDRMARENPPVPMTRSQVGCHVKQFVRKRKQTARYGEESFMKEFKVGYAQARWLYSVAKGIAKVPLKSIHFTDGNDEAETSTPPIHDAADPHEIDDVEMFAAGSLNLHASSSSVVVSNNFAQAVAPISSAAANQLHADSLQVDDAEMLDVEDEAESVDSDDLLSNAAMLIKAANAVAAEVLPLAASQQQVVPDDDDDDGDDDDDDDDEDEIEILYDGHYSGNVSNGSCSASTNTFPSINNVKTETIDVGVKEFVFRQRLELVQMYLEEDGQARSTRAQKAGSVPKNPEVLGSRVGMSATEAFYFVRKYLPNLMPKTKEWLEFRPN